MAYNGDYGNYAIGADSTRRKRLFDVFQPYTGGANAKDVMNKLTTELSNALSNGQVRASSSAASSL